MVLCSRRPKGPRCFASSTIDPWFSPVSIRGTKCGQGHREWSNVGTSQEMPSPTRSWKRLRTESSTEPSEEVRPCWHLELRLLASRTMGESISIVLSHQVCGNLLEMSDKHLQLNMSKNKFIYSPPLPTCRTCFSHSSFSLGNGQFQP